MAKELSAFQERFLSGPSEIPLEEISYSRADKLGGGAFGLVYKGTCRGCSVAVKVPKRRHFTPQQLAAFKREMNIWSRLFHPHICLFMGAYVSPSKVLIVTELLSGDLESLLRSKKKLSLYRLMTMAKEAASAIAWLHGQKPCVIHRDIKSSNFLVDKNMRIRVCDFGLSDLAETGIRDLAGAKGTLLYMAPEVMTGAEFNEKADVYSFGIVLWEMLTRSEPFPHHNNVQVFVDSVTVQMERPVIPDGTPQSLCDLMVNCWDADPTKRPTMLEVTTELDRVLPDVAIPDPRGAEFWRAYFCSNGVQDSVPWETFIQAFSQFLGVAPPEPESGVNGYVLGGGNGYMEPHQGDDVDPAAGYDPGVEPADLDPDAQAHMCLKQLLMSEASSTDRESYVRIETFGRVLACLGPIGDNGQAFVDNVRAQCAQKWFFGEMATNAAVAHLMSADRGAFLVRFRNDPMLMGSYVVSKVTRHGAVIHVGVMHRLGGSFAIEGMAKQYPSLAALVAESQFLHLDLNKACNGSKFAHIFASRGHCMVGDGYQQSFDRLSSGSDSEESG